MLDQITPARGHAVDSLMFRQMATGDEVQLYDAIFVVALAEPDNDDAIENDANKPDDVEAEANKPDDAETVVTDVE